MLKKTKFALLITTTLLVLAIYLLTDLKGNIHYILNRRIIKIVAVLVVGVSVSYATLIFQRLTHNRILTPNILGMDVLYRLIQTLIIFVFGRVMVLSLPLQYLLTLLVMVSVGGIVYQTLFKKGKNIYFLLLIGILFGTFFDSISTFLQVIMDPNDFLIVQSRVIGSFNQIQPTILYLTIAIVLATLIYSRRFYRYLDVLTLGKDQAIALGVPYQKVSQQILKVVIILISCATALIGPITFLGFIVVNVAQQLFRTYRYSFLITSSIFISIILLTFGLIFVERIFNYGVAISSIINLIGGVYFLYLLLKENQT